jgi:hypothetical protein
MAQSLEVNIKTTSDVPQAMDKAKSAVSGLGSQLDGIGKKFSTSFKDIFLSFLGPMAILSGVLAYIGKIIAENQKRRDDAHQAAINETNELMSAEDRYYEKKRANETKTKEQLEQAKLTRQEVTRTFLENDPRGKEIISKEPLQRIGSGYGGSEMAAPSAATLSLNKSIQDRVQAILSQDVKNSPLSDTADKNQKTLNTPLGAGVIGVGASPQIALAMEANTTLASIDSKLGELVNAGIASDPTKPLGRKFPLYSPGMTR